MLSVQISGDKGCYTVRRIADVLGHAVREELYFRRFELNFRTQGEFRLELPRLSILDLRKKSPIDDATRMRDDIARRLTEDDVVPKFAGNKL